MCRVLTSLISLLLCTGAVAAQVRSYDNSLEPSSEAHSLPAADAIVRAYDKHALVALGESHGWQEGANFIFSLIRKPTFASAVNDIVVECGNAKYQPVVDRYVTGKRVPITQLRQVWRNMTVLATCDAPIYEQLFHTVRAVNRGLPKSHQLRVLLGEPPIDWGKISKAEDVGPWVEQRDRHYAGVVEREVLAKGRKALLLMGSYHFLWQGFGDDPALTPSTPSPNPSDSNPTVFTTPVPGPKPGQSLSLSDDAGDNVVQLLEKRHPGSVFVVIPHTGYGDPPAIARLEARLASWPIPSLALIKGTWLGTMDAGPLFAGKMMLITDGKATEVYASPHQGKKLEDLVDAYLYLGPKDSMTMSLPSSTVLRDKAYLKELNRRSVIMTGQPFDPGGLMPKGKKLHDSNYSH